MFIGLYIHILFIYIVFCLCSFSL